MPDQLTLRESSTLGVLTREANRDTVFEDRGIGKRFGMRPDDLMLAV